MIFLSVFLSFFLFLPLKRINRSWNTIHWSNSPLDHTNYKFLDFVSWREESPNPISHETKERKREEERVRVWSLIPQQPRGSIHLSIFFKSCVTSFLLVDEKEKRNERKIEKESGSVMERKSSRAVNQSSVGRRSWTVRKTNKYSRVQYNGYIKS